MQWSTLDGGLLGFDRTTGKNMLLVSESTRAVVRRAPRTLQVGLLTPCNLSCSFCYRDTTAPSLLDREFVVELLQEAEAWGVLEVAFGGGEPLLFKGFVPMIEELHRTTKLGLNVTTNGLLLTPESMDRLRGRVGEFRLSVYADNHWARTLARYENDPIGLNWLVTPANVDEVAPRVRDFVRRGARNVLILGYKGADPTLHLSDSDITKLERALVELDGLPILLDICLYPRLSHLPHLFPRTDCGAGDDMLAITADRAVQACSFADRRIPFATFDDLKAIWGLLRTAKPIANIGGCTRARFADVPESRVVSGRVLPMVHGDHNAKAFAWHAFASSNSGPYTLLARFKEIDAAKKMKLTLDKAYKAHIDYVVANQERDDYYGPTPPLKALGAAHGFEWPKGEGFAWEGDSFGDREEADALEIETFGTNLIVHIPYGQRIGDRGIEHLCALLGAERVVSIEMDFRVILTPRTPAADNKLESRLEEPSTDGDTVAYDSAREENDVDSLDETHYQVEARLKSGVRQIGFSSTVGGYLDASRLVIELSAFRDVDFQLRGGRIPLRVDDKSKASRATESLGEPRQAAAQNRKITTSAAGAKSPKSKPVATASAGTRRFEFSEGTSNKFWEVEASGLKLTTRFGRIGAKAQASEKMFTTPEAVAKEAAKLVSEKTKKGYVEVKR